MPDISVDDEDDEELIRYHQVGVVNFQICWVSFRNHTSAKLIDIQKTYHQKIHGLHELQSRMECNDTLHGSELGPHWVLGPKYSKFGPMGPKNFAQKFLYTK